MVRRRREAAAESTDATSPLEQKPEGPEPRIDVRMSGTATAVKQQLMGGGSEEKPEKARPDGNGHDDEKRKFVEALRNPKYIIRVKRMTPREFNGLKTNVEVWSAELPLDYQEIQAEVTKAFGGEKYRVAIVDPQSNNTIAADVFTVDGDPIVPETDMSQAELDRVIMGGQKSAADLTEEGLDRRARVSAKMLEVEALEAQLEEARSRRRPGVKQGAQDDTRINDLERRLVESKHQAELEARDRRHAEEMRELKQLIAQQAKPKDETNNMMMMLLEQMREDRKTSQAQFNAMLSQMKDDKMNVVLEEVKSIRNKPQQQTPMLEMAQAMLQMKKLFGWDSGADDDDEDDDDANDDRPWWERAIDKLGGKFGEKFLDKLVEKFSGMEGKGEEVTREQFIKDLEAEAKRVADEAVAKARRPAAGGALPAPALPPARPVVSAPPAPVTTLPPPSPAAGPQGLVPPVEAPPTEAAQQPVQVPQKMTVEQEIVIRVGGVLEMIDRESELRPNEYHWNYEGCFLALPEAILEKVCASPDPVTMLDAFAIEHISPEGIAQMKAKVSANPRMLSWLKMGHDELKEWWTQKQADPKFDPFADEEEGEGE